MVVMGGGDVGGRFDGTCTRVACVAQQQPLSVRIMCPYTICTPSQALAALYAAPPLLCEAFPSIVQETPPPNAPTTTTSPDFLTDTLPTDTLPTDTLPTDTLAPHPTTASTNATQPSQQQDPLLQEAREAWRQWRWTVEHVFFAALRMFLKPTKQRASDGSVVELTRTEQLYKVFERC